jgi:hypothetical protein
VPRSEDLPEDLKTLVRRHALGVSHDRFSPDSVRLIGAVERALEDARAEQQRKREEEQGLTTERCEGEEVERLQAEQRVQKEHLELERLRREEQDRFEALG